MKDMKDYEQMYKEALERCKSWMKGEHPETFTQAIKAAEFIFPELKESEYERIKKEILEIVSISGNGNQFEEIKDWLEKQGEQKPTDNVEPKFKVGDWITNNCAVWCIESIHDRLYDLKGSNGCTLKNIEPKLEDKFHLWAIQDAKDGDILFDIQPFIFKKIDSLQHSYAYCGIDGFSDFRIESEGEWTWSQNIKPATKEQRDILFQKMKEAGYEWDDEKKELRKIEHNCYHNDGLYYAIDILEKTFGKVEGYQSDDGKMEHQAAIETVNALYHKKPNIWSEEDEEKLNSIIEVLGEDSLLVNWLKSLKDRVQPQAKQEWRRDNE